MSKIIFNGRNKAAILLFLNKHGFYNSMIGANGEVSFRHQGNHIFILKDDTLIFSDGTLKIVKPSYVGGVYGYN